MLLWVDNRRDMLVKQWLIQSEVFSLFLFWHVPSFDCLTVCVFGLCLSSSCYQFIVSLWLILRPGYIYWYSELQCFSPHISQFVAFVKLFHMAVQNWKKKEEPLARNVRSHRYSYIAVLFLQATSLSVFKLKEAKIYILYFCQTQQYLFILLWQHVLANWPPSAQIYKTQNKLQSSANNIFVIWYPIKFLFKIIYSWYVSSLWYIRVVFGCV